MLEGIRVGLTGEKELEVTLSQTIAGFDAALPAVFATPAMIALMEWTAAETIGSDLPSGHISVGTEVNVRHLAATPLGDRVRATARVLEVTGNLVKFAVEAHDSRQLVGEGTHTRAIIELERFLRGLKRRAEGGK